LRLQVCVCVCVCVCLYVCGGRCVCIYNMCVLIYSLSLSPLSLTHTHTHTCTHTHTHTGHNSTVNFVQILEDSQPSVQTVSHKHLPFVSIAFLSDNSLIAVGWDFNPALFTASGDEADPVWYDVCVCVCDVCVCDVCV